MEPRQQISLLNGILAHVHRAWQEPGAPGCATRGGTAAKRTLTTAHEGLGRRTSPIHGATDSASCIGFACEEELTWCRPGAAAEHEEFSYNNRRFLSAKGFELSPQHTFYKANTAAHVAASER